MAIRIRSLLSSGPIMVPLNSGQTVRLSAGQASGELPDVEVAGNAKVERLRRQGAIDVEQAGTTPEATSTATSATASGAASKPASEPASGGDAEPGARARKRTEPPA